MSELLGIARLKLHEGKLEEFKRLSAQCMEIGAYQDTGTLHYETYFNDNQSEAIVLERHKDSEALIEHTENLGHLAGAILATGSVFGELRGQPSEELRAMLADGPSVPSRPSCLSRQRSPVWARLPEPILSRLFRSLIRPSLGSPRPAIPRLPTNWQVTATGAELVPNHLTQPGTTHHQLTSVLSRPVFDHR